MEQIDLQAESALNRLPQAIEQQVSQEKARIDALFQDPSILETAVQRGQLSQEQKTLLEQLHQNTDSFEKYLERHTENEIERLKAEIAQRRSSAKTELRKAATDQLEGAWSIALKESDSIFHSLQNSRLIVLPQQGERLLLGEPENLSPYILIQDASSNTTQFVPCPQS